MPDSAAPANSARSGASGQPCVPLPFADGARALLPLLVIETSRHLESRRLAGTVPGAVPGAAPGEPASGVAIVRSGGDGAAPRIQIEACAAGLTRGGDLVSAIERLVAAAALAPADIAAVGVNIGPGSWTGLRIAVSAAKALAQAAPIPLIAIDGLLASGLEFMAPGKAPDFAAAPSAPSAPSAPAEPAEPAAPSASPAGRAADSAFARKAGTLVCVLQDSGHGKVCSAVYRCLPGGWPETVVAPQMTDPEALRETLQGSEGILLGVETLAPNTRAAWERVFPTLPEGWRAAVRPRSIEVTARACVTAAKHGRLILRPDQIHPLAPLYLKDPYAP